MIHVRNGICRILVLLCAILVILLFSVVCYARENPDAYINWGEAILIHDFPQFTDAGKDYRGELPGNFGSQFPRMLICDNGDWLVAYTIYDNNGYLADSLGGTRLQISKSTDRGKSWSILSTIQDSGRDLDNAQMIQLKSGEILLACRSVKWYQSYQLKVYKSVDNGKSWSYCSTIDEISGEAESLRNPDRGVYEPYMLQMDDGRVGVMYASEKYALSSPAYSQVLVLKLSDSDGESWGEEIWSVFDTEHENARPGMPVWTKMANGKYILVYEIVGTTDVDVFYKISEDGIHWPDGMGVQIPGQKGAPFVLSLQNGDLLVTSNTHQISVSTDYASHWTIDGNAPYGSLFAEDDNLWPGLYETGTNEIAIVTSVGRAAAGYKDNGHNIQIRFGFLQGRGLQADYSGCFKLMSRNSGKYLDLSAGSMQDDANIQIWHENNETPQEWEFVHLGNNDYKIISVHSGKVLTVDGNNPGANVVQQAWTALNSQKWEMLAAAPGYYSIKSKIGDFYLDVDAGKTEDGTNVQVWTGNNLPPQQWQLEVVQGIQCGRKYYIAAKHSGKVLDVEDQSMDAGANVQQGTFTGSESQQWSISLQGQNGYYNLVNVNSQLCLDVAAGSILNGANIQQWSANNLNPQQWLIVGAGHGIFHFVSHCSGKYLDVDAGKIEDRANVQQWECNRLLPQSWRIIVA